MNLCWIIADDVAGGVATVATTCCEKAAEAGHEATLLMLRAPSQSIEKPTAYRLTSLYLDGDDPESTRELWRRVEHAKPHVLLINACNQADALPGYLSLNIRCVYVVHDTAFCCWRPAIEKEESIDAIIAVSQTVANEIRPMLRNKQKLHVVHNGSSFPKRSEPALFLSDDLLFLGGDNPSKGSYDVIRLWKELYAMGFRGALHWFGTMGARFQAQLNSLPNASRIILHGRANRHTIFDVAARCKVALVLTRAEAFGMATIEAMSMGCLPVFWEIATGTREVVSLAGLHFTAPLGEYRSLALAVLRACRNHSALRLEVAEYVRQKFNGEVMWQGYDVILRQVIDSTPAIRPRAGMTPPKYQTPRRRYQLLPRNLRQAVSGYIGRSPKLSYRLRNYRGW